MTDLFTLPLRKILEFHAFDIKILIFIYDYAHKTIRNLNISEFLFDKNIIVPFALSSHRQNIRA